jgi:cobalt-zinc-cadmium efflux system membrane fusion protein
MKRWLGLILLATLGLASADCAGSTPASVTAPPSPPASAPASSAITASVKVVPAQIADLSFVVSGPVKDVTVKAGDQVKAGQPLISLDAPDLAYAETAAESALRSAQADAFIQSQGRRKWDGLKFVWNSGPPEQRQEADARVVQAQASLVVAQARLAQATLLAPFDGTVASITVSQGETVQPDQTVMTIGSLAHLRLETTDLSERLIAGVRLGQPAAVRLKAFADPLSGHVSAISPLAGRSADGDTVFKVTFELDQQPPSLMWGMTGDVDIQPR